MDRNVRRGSDNHRYESIHETTYEDCAPRRPYRKAVGSSIGILEMIIHKDFEKTVSKEETGRLFVDDEKGRCFVSELAFNVLTKKVEHQPTYEAVNVSNNERWLLAESEIKSETLN